ncbi:uncharacterized protein LOC125491145 [Plutella xylostella]|uniref:uncharacterized protein LOC125491145 n=1 Tax=Plutella xylostella TaxID=51655 RepID=UPI0020326136|nr:uncharacterized protein LOC125491145 [Plutella xylostella]
MTMERTLRYCECGNTCYGVFKEDVDMGGAGVKVYSYIEKPPAQSRKIEILESIIVTNVKQVNPQASDFCKDIRSKLEENKRNCTVCRRKFEHMMELLEELPPVNENHISAICQRCKLLEIECPRCQYYLTKFIKNQITQQDNTQLKCKERMDLIKEFQRDNQNCRGVCSRRFLNNENEDIEDFHKFPKIDSKLLSADKDYANFNNLKPDSDYNSKSKAFLDSLKLQKSAFTREDETGAIKHLKKSNLPFGKSNRHDITKDEEKKIHKQNKKINSNQIKNKDSKNKENLNRSPLKKSNKEKIGFQRENMGPGHKYNKSKGSKAFKSPRIGKKSDPQNKKGKKSTKGASKNDAVQNDSNRDEPNKIENNKNASTDNNSKRSPKEVGNEFDEVVKERKVKYVPELFDDQAKAVPGTGKINYALSDKKFIDIGWTRMPPLLTKRRVFVFEMLPGSVENNWFDKNKNKTMHYNTGEMLAEVDAQSTGNWYYRNGTVALSKDSKTCIVYDHDGENSLLAKFDHLGNGVVYGPTGDVRLQYNQFEGRTLDSQFSYPKRWQWHSLNDPPMKERELLEDVLTPPDPNISRLIQKYGRHPHDHQKPLAESPTDNDYVKRIDIENSQIFNSQKEVLAKKIVPFKIQMQALQINECFSLHIVNQHQIFIHFRPPNSKFMKHNVGLHLDKSRIIAMNKIPYSGLNAEIGAALTDKTD